MLNKIEIMVDNFSLINNATFELNKITVIKGGDFESLSDLNRILFANLISLSCEGDYAANNLFKTRLMNSLGDSNNLSFSFMRKFNKFINDWDEYNVSYKYLSKKYKQFKKIVPKKLKVDFDYIDECLALFEESKMYKFPVFVEMLNREFKSNKLAKYDNYEIKIILDGEYESFIKSKNKQSMAGINPTLDLPGNVIYLDKTTLFDLAQDLDAYYHYEELYSNIFETHIECKSDTDEIDMMIEETIQGNFDGVDAFFPTDSNDMLDVSELSVQVKQLGTILSLLEGYGIPEKSILILNNIDAEMDDEFIKKTAEIIAKLISQLDLLVLINTQRDDFVDALNEYCDDLLLYNASENKDGSYDFKLD